MRDAGAGAAERDGAELSADDELLRLILESATDYAIFTTDPEGLVTAWPAGAQAVFGYGPAEILGRSCALLFTPEDRAAGEDRKELETAAREGCSEDERWHLRKDGRRVFMNGSVRPLFEDGRLRGFLKIAREETERRRSGEALRDTERRLNAVLDNATLAIFQMDERQQCVYMNAAAEALTGYALEETLGRPLHDVIHHTHPDGRPYPLSECPIDQAFPENNQEQGEEIFVHKDGSFYPVAFTASPVRDEAGRPVGTVIEVRATAQEKAAQAALREQQRRESFLFELGEVLRGLTDAMAVTAAAAEALGRQLGVSRVGYGEVDAAGETVSVERDWTDGSVASLAGESRPLDSFGPAVIAELRAGRTLWLDDIAADPRSEPYAAGYASIGTRSLLVVPLIKDGGLVAALYLHEPEPRRWTDGDALLAEDVAERTWAAVEKARSETALRSSEARLRTTETQLRAILDSVPVGILMAEAPDGRVVQANRYLETLLRRPVTFGVPNYEGREAYDGEGRRLEPGDWPVSRVIRDGEPVKAEVRFRKGDGSLGWIRIQAAPVRDAAGQLTGAVAGVTDLEEIVQAREVLARARGELEQRVDAALAERNRVWTMSQDLFATMGFDGYLKAINPAWSRLLGYDEATLLSTHVSEIAHPDDLGRVKGLVEALLRGESVSGFEDRLRRADGKYVTISWNAAPAEDVFYAVGRDVTREREQEEQLRQAQKMEAVGQLTGGIAHDFNNLLQIVVGNLELTQRNLPVESPRLKRSVDNAMTGAKRAATLTQRLLAFSRRQPLEPKPVSVNKLVAGMSELLARSLGETVQVETVLAGGLWRVEVDPNQLENAIVNLAVNARDAMPDGGKLTIETANTRLDESYAQQNVEVTPGQYVVICVSDTGTGMSKEELARAFEPFFTTKQIGKGTGLGLSQVYGFVKQSGGHVKIYSEAGEKEDHHRGTTVKVYLPRYLGSGEEGDDEPEAENAPEGGLEETILVVEDDADVRAYTVEVLRELGYGVVEAPDGATALKLLRDAETRCDLLFTDVVLPGGMNGEQLASEAHQARPGLRVLFTTGYARNAIVHHGRLDPGVKLITKPFTYADLAARVRDVLDEPPPSPEGQGRVR